MSPTKSLLLATVVASLAACSAVSTSDTPAGAEPAPSAHFRILQVNDSYKIEGLENGNVGGFARLRTLRRQLQADTTPVLLLHGGDFLFPSVMSKYLQADAMVQVMNLLDGAPAAFDHEMMAVFGNHEFDTPDAGLLLRRIVQSDFSWISSNTRFKFSESAVAEPFSQRVPQVHDVCVKDIAGVKVGFFGITLDSRKPAYVEFAYDLPARRTAIRNALDRLQSQGATAIVALTHQDLDQDQWLAREYPEVNLIVGGHEHFFIEQQIGNTWITKADADNKSAIVHDIYLAAGKFSSSHRKVDLDQSIAKDPMVAAEVDRQLQRLAGVFQQQGKDLKQVLGYTEHLLEGVEPAVRGRETALGNFLADTMRERMRTDIAFTNGGGIRINDNIPAGPVTLYDMEGLFSYDNKLVSFELTGQQLLEVLNNSVSKAHLGDGRFLQVSGIRFGYRAEPLADGGFKYRVDAGDVQIRPRGTKQDQALDLYKTYSVASTDFIWEHGSSDDYAIFGKGAGKTSPRRLDDGTAVGFRQTVEAAIANLPQRTITQQVEGRIVRLQP
ncbi:bifunctional metallophosphatase/5'-nucleotidase [Methylomonas sp. HW2-6]|uniref:bifunctional metallophosphatase/5'-nucleotidase n=1 Tax=Methylomonas sp. HW2-6 TaxID=3376687 RepID=UPI0040429C96